MSAQHSKATVVTLGGDPVTIANSTTYNRSRDVHDVTGYGANSKVYAPGLLDGTVTVEGIYDNAALTGTKAVVQAAFEAGTTIEFVYQPEGAGTGKPQNVCDVIVTAYNESSAVADMVQFTAELQITGDVDVTPQA